MNDNKCTLDNDNDNYLQDIMDDNDDENGFY